MKYWQEKLKGTGAKVSVSSDDDDDSKKELDDDFSDSEVKFSDPGDKDEDDEYSMNDDDDFAISSSFKQANASKTDPFGASKKSDTKKSGTSAAKERLNKILEEEKKQAREARLKEIMRQQKAELRKKMIIF